MRKADDRRLKKEYLVAKIHAYVFIPNPFAKRMFVKNDERLLIDDHSGEDSPAGFNHKILSVYYTVFARSERYAA